MTYIVLARKWRPLLFEDVIGQEHITQILINALKNERIGHAFIFAGPRGVGKTSTARLLAKAVNCEKYPVVNPCNQCPTCKSITDGHSLDVIEIDGASNRGIDEIRNLRENIRFAPASSRYKIYIIDEVHMLTKEAFNALLKTLEEPPSHAIFIFATTEIHRVPLTILSRCQRFDFKRITVSKIQELLTKITKSEKIKIEPEALLLIARKAEGSMRDAESILDQMISFGGTELSAAQVRNSLGLIDQEIFFEFTDLLPQQNTAEILTFARKIFSSGHDLIDFIHGLEEHFRNLLLTSALKDTKFLDVAEHFKKRYQECDQVFSDRDLIHYLHIVAATEQSLKFSAFPELTLEMLLLKLAFKPASVSLEEIIALLEKKTEAPVATPQEGASPVSKKMHTPLTSPEKTGTDERESDIPDTGSSELIHHKSKKAPNGFSSLEGTLKGLQKLKNSPTLVKSETQPEREINLEAVKTQWDAIVEKVRSQKVALGAFLQEGIPYQALKGKLIIAYDHSATFHQEHVEKNRKIVEKILKDDFQLPVGIGFKSINFKNEGIEKQPRTPEEIVADIKSKEPIIRKIIDIFDLDESVSKDM